MVSHKAPQHHMPVSINIPLLNFNISPGNQDARQFLCFLPETLFLLWAINAVQPDFIFLTVMQNLDGVAVGD